MRPAREPGSSRRSTASSPRKGRPADPPVVRPCNAGRATVPSPGGAPGWPRPSNTPMNAASSTATSSPPTCWSRPTACRCCSTSTWPASPWTATDRPPRPPRAARWITWRPSISRPWSTVIRRGWTTARTSTAWASCSTRPSRDAVPSPPRAGGLRWGRPSSGPPTIATGPSSRRERLTRAWLRHSTPSSGAASSPSRSTVTSPPPSSPTISAPSPTTSRCPMPASPGPAGPAAG